MKRLPLCAHCGQPLPSGVHVQLTWEDLPGRPSVGWHWECEAMDELRKLLDQDPIPFLRSIHARGPGRLLAGVRFWRLIEVNHG